MKKKTGTNNNNIDVGNNIHIYGCHGCHGNRHSGGGDSNGNNGRIWLQVVIVAFVAFVAFVVGLFLWELRELLEALWESFLGWREYWTLNGFAILSEILTYFFVIAIICVGITTGIFILLFDKIRLVAHLNR